MGCRKKAAVQEHISINWREIQKNKFSVSIWWTQLSKFLQILRVKLKLLVLSLYAFAPFSPEWQTIIYGFHTWSENVIVFHTEHICCQQLLESVGICSVCGLFCWLQYAASPLGVTNPAHWTVMNTHRASGFLPFDRNCRILFVKWGQYWAGSGISLTRSATY